ncbi:MAG: phosphoadenylyl-sulfate reductase [Bacteroidales bacterium]|nr:phosphoadenylyl-sulfate reductase [Bacteroidales bacterium]
MIDTATLQNWNAQLKDASPEEIIAFSLKQFQGKIALSTSLGLEDQVLTHMLCQIDPTAKIFTLDTGRLFPETYDLIDRTNRKYNIKIQVYFPDPKDVEEMVSQKGINLFYESIENRKLCCQVRKVKPLQRAMQGLDAWITGLRKSQSTTRTELQFIEYDNNNHIVKINPLANWEEEDAWNYVEKNRIPVNPLHKKGFASIGCQPCTRAIESGEDIRAGRWWWENPETRECGLHKR